MPADESEVTFDMLVPGESFGVIIRPRGEPVDLVAWTRAHRPVLERKLLDHGAVLFRGFDLELSGFQSLASAVSPVELGLAGGNSPRPKVVDGVYVSTEYPAHLRLLQHHERSFARVWPMKIMFFCRVPSKAGGETRICSSRRFGERLGLKLVELFASREITYTRKYTGDMTWQLAYDTDDKDVVRRFCEANGIECDWDDGDKLTTRQTAQGAARHPATGELLYFNQAHTFHASNFLRKHPERSEAESPTEASWANGAPIERSLMDEVVGHFDEGEVAFRWERGDALVLDNMLASHGRRAFEGPRGILAALRQPYSTPDDAAPP